MKGDKEKGSFGYKKFLEMKLKDMKAKTKMTKFDEKAKKELEVMLSHLNDYEQARCDKIASKNKEEQKSQDLVNGLSDDLAHVKSEVCGLRNSVARIEKSLPDWKGEAFFRIVAEVMKALNSTDSKGLKWLKEHGKYPVSESKKQYVESEGANDVKSGIRSETPSLIVLGSNLNNYNQQPQHEDNVKGMEMHYSEVEKETSNCSRSPLGNKVNAPEKDTISRCAKTKHGLHVRSLFPSLVFNPKDYVKNVKSSSDQKIKFKFGNYYLKNHISDNEATILKFLFAGKSLIESEKR